MTDIVLQAVNRLSRRPRDETAGAVADMVGELVNQIHNAVRVGKGDQNLDLRIGGSGHRRDKDEGDAKRKKRDRKSGVDSDVTRVKKRDTSVEDAPGEEPIDAEWRDAHEPTHPPAARLALPAPAGATPPSSGSPGTTRGPSSSGPTHGVPAVRPTPAPHAPAPTPAAPGAKKPTVTNPKNGKSGSIRPEHLPGGKHFDPNNDPTDATVKKASRDVQVRGTINGRTITTTISSGQYYHLKDVDGKTQLVLPGLFGKFFVSDEDKGKL